MPAALPLTDLQVQHGCDIIRKQWFDNQKRMGVIPQDAKPEYIKGVHQEPFAGVSLKYTFDKPENLSRQYGDKIPVRPVTHIFKNVIKPVHLNNDRKAGETKITRLT